MLGHKATWDSFLRFGSGWKGLIPLQSAVP